MLVSRIISSIRRIITSAPDTVLLDCQARLKHLLTDKRRMFLHSQMMIDNLLITMAGNPSFHVNPLTGERVPPYRSVQEVIQRTKRKFGPNHNLITELAERFKGDPKELSFVVDRLEKIFDQMEARGFIPRRMVPVLYIWITDDGFSSIPQNIYKLRALIDKIGKLIDEGSDPSKVLWHDALVGKSQSAGSFVIYP